MVMQFFDFKEVEIINSDEPLVRDVPMRIKRGRKPLKPVEGEQFLRDEAETYYSLSYLEMDSETLKKALLV
jgi:hypothetical protein